MPIDKKRTNAIHIYTPAAEPPRVEIVRETRRTYEGGDTAARPEGERRVRVNFADIAQQDLPGGPVRLATYEDLRALLSACAHALAGADEEAEAGRRAKLKPNKP